MLFLMAATHSACCRHATVYVDDRSGSGQGSGTRRDPYHDLTFAVQRAISVQSAPPGFLAEGNILARNREAGGKPGSGDIGEQEFLQRMESICHSLPALTYGSKSSF